MEKEKFTKHQIWMGQAVLEYLNEKQELGATSVDLVVCATFNIVP